MQTQSNTANAYQRPFNGPNSNLNNLDWRCKPNLNGKNGPMVNTNNASQGPPQKSNLEDTLNAFMIGQTQINQSIMQAMNELKISVERIETHLGVREKGTVLTQSHLNPKEQLETNTNSSTHPHVEHVQAITTLRSGKIIKNMNQ